MQQIGDVIPGMLPTYDPDMTGPTTAQDPMDALKDTILGDVNDDLRDFLEHAKVAIWNSDANVHTTFTTTVSLKKKMVADEMKITMEINSRERIPKPIIKRDLEFNGSKQLVLL